MVWVKEDTMPYQKSSEESPPDQNVLRDKQPGMLTTPEYESLMKESRKSIAWARENYDKV